MKRPRVWAAVKGIPAAAWRRRIEVKVEPREDRAQPGTKLDRDPRPPLGIRIRYAVIMAALATVGIGTGVAWHNTDSLSTQGERLKTVVASNTSLTHRVAALASQNSALVARVAHDERQTCVIQARGLPAGHDLAAAMADIHELLLLPSSQQPPPVVAVIIADLNGQLSAYLTLESHQPASRTC